MAKEPNNSLPAGKIELFVRRVLAGATSPLTTNEIVARVQAIDRLIKQNTVNKALLRMSARGALTRRGKYRGATYVLTPLQATSAYDLPPVAPVKPQDKPETPAVLNTPATVESTLTTPLVYVDEDIHTVQAEIDSTPLLVRFHDEYVNPAHVPLVSTSLPGTVRIYSTVLEIDTSTRQPRNKVVTLREKEDQAQYQAALAWLATVSGAPAAPAETGALNEVKLERDTYRDLADEQQARAQVAENECDKLRNQAAELADEVNEQRGIAQALEDMCDKLRVEATHTRQWNSDLQRQLDESRNLATYFENERDLYQTLLQGEVDKVKQLQNERDTYRTLCEAQKTQLDQLLKTR